MAMTIEEKKAYTRGYNRARSRCWDRVQRAVQIAKSYRARLTDIHPSLQCRDCDRWMRGGPDCVWGRCRADFEFGVEGRMWAEVTGNSKDVKSAIITTEDFGCVNWIPKSSEPQI